MASAPMPVLKNQKHEAFAQELAKGTVAIDAFMKIGYSRNEGNCSRLKNNEKIQARVQEIRGRTFEKIIEKTAISRIWVLDMLRENLERAMQHRAVLDGDGEPIGEYTYQGNVANRALELIGKEIGMFVDRKDFRLVNEFDNLSDTELVTELAKTAQLLLTDQSEPEEK